MTAIDSVDAYLSHLATQRRMSAHTIAAYRHDLRQLEMLAGGVALINLQVVDLRRTVAKLHAGGLSGRSLARHLSAWRGFYRWLAQRGEITCDPTSGIRPPKSPQRLPKVLSPDEANRLLGSASKAGEMAEMAVQDQASLSATEPDLAVLDRRDSAMFELFYSSGLRLSELAGIDIDCLDDVRQGEVRVLGKRAKTRIVPVGAAARAAIEAWLMVRSQLAAPEQTALFVGRRGARISPRVIQQRLARRAKLQGLPQHVHPHMLRHSFASHVLQSSGDLRAVQEMLGHASIASTQVYTHLDFQHLAQIYDAAHPRAKKK